MQIVSDVLVFSELDCAVDNDDDINNDFCDVEKGFYCLAYEERSYCLCLTDESENIVSVYREEENNCCLIENSYCDLSSSPQTYYSLKCCEKETCVQDPNSSSTNAGYCKCDDG